ncbi:MAG: GNAT family N-acetyltransferase [Verrucomicrobiota bacterium]
MERFSEEEFRANVDRFDEAVTKTPGLARFCSSSTWQLAALDCLRPPCDDDERLIVEDEEGNWLVFAERERNRVFFPFEAAWMFGCPFAGNPLAAPALLKAAGTEFFSSRIGFCLGGVPKAGALHQSLRGGEANFLRYEEFEGTDCMLIDLADGYEAWLERRSKKFRKAVRQIRRNEEIEIVDASQEVPHSLFERILAIQEKTYKWEEGTDIFLGNDYRPFYRRLLESLHSAGDLRLLFVQRGGEDLAYIFGGVQGNIYRGFQMGFVESERKAGLGILLQHENLKARAEEGITTYDLGMYAEYKERWADRREEYLGVFVVL